MRTKRLRRASGLARTGFAAFASCAASASAAAILLSPRALLACAVCTSGREDESNAAFLVSTIFLSLLPLGALGTLVYVLWRRFQKLEQAEVRAGLTPDLAGSENLSTSLPPVGAPVSSLS